MLDLSRTANYLGELTDDEYQSERDKVKDDLAKLQQDREELQESHEATVDMERGTKILDRLADQIGERLALNDVEALKDCMTRLS